MPSRRTLLRTGGLAGFSVLAGCLSGSPFDAPTPASGTWPTTRRGPTNAARTPAATPPRASPEVAWRAEAAGAIHDLLVADRTVYATHPRGAVAYEATTGDRRWTVEWGSIVPAGKRVGALDGGTLYTADDASLRAVDANDGTRLWSHRITAETADPLRGYGLKVTDSGPLLGFHGGLAAFDREGSHRWTVRPGGLGWVYPAVAHGRLYVGSPGPLFAYARSSRVNRVLDPAPRAVWEGRGPAFCSWPVVAGDRIVVADREPLRDGGTTTVWAYERDGTLDWKRRVPGTGRAPAVAEETVVVSAGTDPSTVRGLDAADGTVRWERESRRYVRDPIVAGGVVLVAGAPEEPSRGETVRALDAETGDRLWAVAVGGRAERLAAVGDRVYVGTDAGRVVTLA